MSTDNFDKQHTKIALPIIVGLAIALGMFIGKKLDPVHAGAQSAALSAVNRNPGKVEEILRYIDARYVEDVDNGELWVAENMNDEGHVLGMAALTEEQSIEYKDCGWDITIPAIVMHRAAVAPFAQGQGISQLFFAKQDEISRERGYNLVRVDTNRVNDAMQRSIRKAGYEYSGDVRLLTKPETMKFMCFQKYLS